MKRHTNIIEAQSMEGIYFRIFIFSSLCFHPPQKTPILLVNRGEGTAGAKGPLYSLHVIVIKRSRPIDRACTLTIAKAHILLGLLKALELDIARVLGLRKQPLQTRHFNLQVLASLRVVSPINGLIDHLQDLIRRCTLVLN